jgi:hypothetical protein
MKKHIAFLLFTLFIIIIGLCVFRDYGVSWDEEAQIELGRVNYSYISRGNPTLLSYPYRYYGPFVSTIVWRLTVNLPDPAMIYYRHLATFIIFVMGMIALYGLAYRLFRNSWWSLLTVILLILSPRIFGDSFYNPKDIPFLSFYTIALLSLVIFVDYVWKGKQWINKIGAVSISAIACAMAVDIRLPGMVLVLITSILLISIFLRNPKRWKDVGILLISYLTLTFGFIILFWPILWHDPFHELINAYINMSHYPWNVDVLYRGQMINSSKLPWHYIPTWILISTPLLQLGGFTLGILYMLTSVIKKGIFNNSAKFSSFSNKVTVDSFAWFAVFGSLVIPLAVIIILHSVVYDSWRQMFFIYPSMLLIAVYGLKTVYGYLSNQFNHSGWLKIIACAILVVGIWEPLDFIIKYHPHENVFFNVFAGKPSTLRQKYELDYWGLSYKQGIDYILAHDPTSKISLAYNDSPADQYIRLMLQRDEASRLAYAPLDQADYFITIFRWHPQDYYIGKEYFSINIRGTVIMEVYKIK